MGKVEIVHIPIEGNALRSYIAFAEGMTVEDVLSQSGLLETHPELVGLPIGIFSRTVQLNTQVRSGDRIEIYRPLRLDPMEIRRQRAKKK